MTKVGSRMQPDKRGRGTKRTEDDIGFTDIHF